jgi:hypothetical protein
MNKKPAFAGDLQSTPYNSWRVEREYKPFFETPSDKTTLIDNYTIH